MNKEVRMLDVEFKALDIDFDRFIESVKDNRRVSNCV